MTFKNQKMLQKTTQNFRSKLHLAGFQLERVQLNTVKSVTVHIVGILSSRYFFTIIGKMLSLGGYKVSFMPETIGFI